MSTHVVHTVCNVGHAGPCHAPHVTLICRNLDATAAKAAAELAAGQAVRRAKIVEQLAQEDKEYQKKVVKKELDRQVGHTAATYVAWVHQ